MSADSDAFLAAQKLPGLTPGEQQYLLAVARGEGRFGLGWDSVPAPNTLFASQTAALGLVGNEGSGSNNWGAVQGTGSAGNFPHLDHDSHGKPYKGIFKRYTTSQEGAVDMARILLKPNVKDAIAKGDMRGAVYAQHANGYFELAPDKYLSAVKGNYDSLAKSLNWPVLLTVTPPTLLETIAANPLASGPQSSELGSSSFSEPSLHLGSVGSGVSRWQQIIGAKPDGIFGQNTLSATRAWQSKHGLAPDGQVGPLTWSKALGKE